MSIVKRLHNFLYQETPSDPIDWIQRNISLRHDPTSAHDGLVRLDPHQIRPIRAQYQPEVREVTVMGVEQAGKSACWRFPMVHKMIEYPGPRWIIYESDDKAADINEEQLDPLLRNAPGLGGQLNRKTALKHRYNLPNGSTTDFSGAGADITSKPKRDGVADELDTWPLTLEGIRQNLRNFKKRFRTYWVRGEGCLVKVSSPSPKRRQETKDLTQSAIGEEFDHSDQGYWTLRCLKCGKLSMPSHAIYNLQWECDDNDNVKPKTLALECPSCNYRHSEKHAQKMNEKGAYCTKGGKDLTGIYSKHVGCQFGALAAPRVFKWQDIAEAQMEAGSTADIYAQAYFDNSWRGLPFKPRRKQAPGVKTIVKHCAPLPDAEKIANVFFAADTQDDGWYWITRGIDQEYNSYLLDYGFVRDIDSLKAEWDKERQDIMPVLGIIDEGGHSENCKHVRQLVMAEQGLYGYKGAAPTSDNFYLSKHVDKLIIGKAKHYQVLLLSAMYDEQKAENSRFQWYIPQRENITDDYLEQLAALRPNNRAKHGDQYENYTTPENDTPDHYFDCEKEWFLLRDFALKHLPAKQWRLQMPPLVPQSVKPKQKKRRAPAMEV
jgi:hypothetical protein